MDRPGSVERRLAAPERPGPRLLLGGREERDQVNGVEEPARDLADRGRAVAKLRRLVLGELGELGLELRVEAAGPVADLDERLRRQRLETSRKLARPLGGRPLGLEMSENSLERRDLGSELLIARLRLLAHALQPLLDVIAVGDQQLEPKRLQVVVRAPRARPRIQDDEQRVDLAQVAEQLSAGSGNIDDAKRSRRDLLRVLDRRDRLEPLVGNRGPADLLPARHRGPCAPQSLEERRLAGVRQADDADREGQGLLAYGS